MANAPSRFRFTQKAIEALPPNPPHARSTEAEYSDTQIPGFKCLVGKGEGSKKFLLRYLWQGRKRAISIGRFPDVDLNTAREIATNYKRLLSQGIDPKQQKEDKRQELTLTELFEQHYFPYAMHHKRSWKDDAQRFRDHLKPALGSRLLSEIKLEQGQALQTNLLSKVKPATNNRITTLLKAILTWSVRMGYLEQHPMRHLKSLTENNQRTRYLDKGEIRRLFMAADADENRYAGQYVKQLLLTGLRKDELRLAKWEHLDQSQLTLFIPHTKNGKSRILHLNHMAMQILKETHPIEGNPYLFPGQKQGQPLNNVTRPFNRMLKRARIEGPVCIHTCRHSVAALIVSSGGTLYDVQAQLGHASSQTSQRYAHLHASRLRHTSTQVANCVEQALIPSCTAHSALPQLSQNGGI